MDGTSKLGLRRAVNVLVLKWEGADDKVNDNYHVLKRLLGLSQTEGSLANAAPEVYALLEVLAGPNGYAVYKMLLAKQRVSGV